MVNNKNPKYVKWIPIKAPTKELYIIAKRLYVSRTKDDDAIMGLNDDAIIRAVLMHYINDNGGFKNARHPRRDKQARSSKTSL